MGYAEELKKLNEAQDELDARKEALREAARRTPQHAAAQVKLDEFAADIAKIQRRAAELNEELALDDYELDQVARRVQREAVVKDVDRLEGQIALVEAERRDLLSGIAEGDEYAYARVADRDAELRDTETRYRIALARASFELRQTNGWDNVDLSAYRYDLDSPTPPEDALPSVLVRNDGKALFYAGAINCVFGEGGGGKTWLAVLAMAEQVRLGHHVMMLDFEQPHAGKFKRRLQSVVLDGRSITDEEVNSLVHWKHPTEAASDGDVKALVNEIVRDGVTVVVIDSVGEAIAGVWGGDTNSDLDVTQFVNQFLRKLEETGVTVVTIDHVPKSNPKASAPLGAARKYNSATALFRVDKAKAADRPGKGKAGHFHVVNTKDREGDNPGDDVPVADVHFDPVPGTSRIAVELRMPPTAGAKAASDQRDFYVAVIDCAAASPGCSARHFEDVLPGAVAKIRAAVKELIAQDVLTVTPGANRAKLHYLANGLDADSAKAKLNSFVPLVLNGAATD